MPMLSLRSGLALGVLLLSIGAWGSTGHCAGPRRDPGTPLSWRTASALSPADRAFAEMIGGMRRAGLKGAIGIKYLSTFTTPIAAAVLPVRLGNLLFLKFNSTGNCADFKFYVFGPRNRWGLRKDLVDDLCVEELEIEPTGNGIPNLVLPLTTTVAVLHWTGDGWEDPSRIMRQDYYATHGGR